MTKTNIKKSDSFSPLSNTMEESSVDGKGALPPPDNATYIPPEWVESDIASEKFTSKHAYEEEGVGAAVFLPRCVRVCAGELKRFGEVAGGGDLVVVTNPNSDDAFHCQITLPPVGSHTDLKPLIEATTDTLSPNSTPGDHNSLPPTSAASGRHNRRASSIHATAAPTTGSTLTGPKTASRQKLEKLELASNASIKEDSLNSPPTPVIKEPAQSLGDESEYNHAVSKLTAANKHLLTSEFMTHFITTLHFLIDHARVSKMNPGTGDESMPWDCIYPKSKDGAPMYNASGKYIVKLFWMGCWRKVTIDDRVPVDATGKILLAVSPNANEMWVTLIAKAVLKLAVASWRDDELEFGEFDFFQVLKGWVPERVPVSPGQSLSHSLSGVLATTIHRQVKQQPVHVVSSVPSGRLSAMNTPPAVTRTPISFPLIFCTRKPSDFKAYAAKGGSFYQHLPCSYRILDTHRMIGHTSRGFLVRQYLSSGIKRKGEDVEFGDSWILAEEIGQLFGSIVFYHTPGSYRSVKHVTVIQETTKLCETIRTPYILHTPEDLLVGNEPGVLISLSTFGRVAGNVNNGATLLIEEFNVQGPIKEPVLRLCTNTTASTFLAIIPGTAYRISVDANTLFHLSVYSKDDFALDEEAKYVTDTIGMRMREFEDTLPAHQAGTWAVLFKHVVMVNEPAFVACNFLSADSLMLATCVRAINNDNGEEVERSNYGILPFATLSPNKSGYTFVGESRANVARPATKWKFRIYSDVITTSLIEKESFTSKMTIQDVNETYVPNRHNILFRSVIKIKDGFANSNNLSVQVDFSLIGIWLDIVLYDNDVELIRTKGKGVASINNILIHPSEDVPIPVKGNAGPGGDKNKAAAASVPVPVPAPVPVAPSAPKHKYILQCSIASSDVEKLTNSASRGPSARSGKAISSAGKKKRAALVSAASTVTSAAVATNPVAAAVPATTPAVATQQDMPEFTWHARYISTDGASLIIVKDTEKEARYKAIRDTWETAAPGRANKAKETRENFLKLGLKPLVITHQDLAIKPWSLVKADLAPRVLVRGDRNGGGGIPLSIAALETPVQLIKEGSKVGGQKTSRPTTAYPDEIHAHSNFAFSLTGSTVSVNPIKVLQDAQVEEMVKERASHVAQFLELQGEVLKRRSQDKELRQSDKKLLFEIIDAKIKDLECVTSVDLARREAYRVRILAEREEEAQARAKAMMDASKAAELAAETAEENAADKKGRKPAKK